MANEVPAVSPPEESTTSDALPTPPPVANPFAEDDATPAGRVQQPASDVGQEYGFNDDSVSQYEYNLYKARKNQTDRIGFLPPTIHGARCHFKKDVGYFVCHSVFKKVKMGQQIMEIPERIGPCCAAGDSPRKRFIAPIIKYNTDVSGKRLPDLGFALMVWRFTDDTYIHLRAMNEEYPLTEVDVLVTCTNEDWQKLTLQPTRKSLWRDEKWPKESRDIIKQWADLIKPKLPRSLARKYDDRELLEKLGMAPAPQVVAGMDAPLVDVKELLD
jgi:hypothetical protein